MDNTSLLLRMSLKHGIIAGVAYFLFFLLMRLLGLAEHTGLRYINLIILAIVMFIGVRDMHSRAAGTDGYIAGFFTTLGITFISAIVFALLMWFYIGVFDKQFLVDVSDKIPFELVLTPFMFANLIGGEVIPFGIAIGIAVMAYYQRYNRSVDKAMEQAKHAEEMRH